MPSGRALDFVAHAAYVAYMDDRAADAAVLYGAHLELSPLTFPQRFRPILEALEERGLRDESAAGANLSIDEALERAIAVIRPRPAPPA
jgi:hypothetical protein